MTKLWLRRVHREERLCWTPRPGRSAGHESLCGSTRLQLDAKSRWVKCRSVARSASSRAGLPSPRCGPGIANARGGWPRTPNVGHGRNERHGADAMVIGAGITVWSPQRGGPTPGGMCSYSRPSPRPAVSWRAPNCFLGTWVSCSARSTRYRRFRRRCMRLNCRTRTAVIVRARCGWPRPVRRWWGRAVDFPAGDRLDEDSDVTAGLVVWFLATQLMWVTPLRCA